jgi:hypothetical protein
MGGPFETRRQRTGLEELRDDFARRGDDWHFHVERFQFQRGSTEIQAAQMRVAGQKNSAAKQRCLGQNEAVVVLLGRQKPGFLQSIGDPLDDAVADWDEVHQVQAPPSQTAQSLGRLIAACLRVGFVGEINQLLENRGCYQNAPRFEPAPDYRQRIQGGFLAVGKVERKVRINRDDWTSRRACRHR